MSRLARVSPRKNVSRGLKGPFLEGRSSNGAPVTEGYAPDSPTVGPNSSFGGVVENSPFGYASFQTNGMVVQCWACDSGTAPAGLQIDITGNHYVFQAQPTTS